MRDVLLVEDSPDDAVLIQRVNGRGVGVELHWAHDGGEALKRIFGADRARTPWLPRMVLLDLRMPGVPGFDVLESLRGDARTRALPVVVFTSSDEPRDVEECRRLGATAYYRKPDQLDDFDRLVRAILTHWTRDEPNRPPPAGELLNGPDGARSSPAMLL